jgi:hypothetical protein
MGRATMFNIALFKLDIESFVTRGTVPTGRFPDGDGDHPPDGPVNMPVQGAGGSLQGSGTGRQARVSDFWTITASRDFGFDTSYTYSNSKQTQHQPVGRGAAVPGQLRSTSSTPRSGIRATSCRRASRTTTARRVCQRLSNIPIYQDTAQYVDVNVTYNLTDNVTLYANGSNVFGEIEEYYLEFEKGRTQFHSRRTSSSPAGHRRPRQVLTYHPWTLADDDVRVVVGRFFRVILSGRAPGDASDRRGNYPWTLREGDVRLTDTAPERHPQCRHRRRRHRWLDGRGLIQHLRHTGAPHHRGRVVRDRHDRRRRGDHPDHPPLLRPARHDRRRGDDARPRPAASWASASPAGG